MAQNNAINMMFEESNISLHAEWSVNQTFNNNPGSFNYMIAVEFYGSWVDTADNVNLRCQDDAVLSK